MWQVSSGPSSSISSIPQDPNIALAIAPVLLEPDRCRGCGDILPADALLAGNQPDDICNICWQFFSQIRPNPLDSPPAGVV